MLPALTKGYIMLKLFRPKKRAYEFTYSYMPLLKIAIRIPTPDTMPTPDYTTIALKHNEEIQAYIEGAMASFDIPDQTLIYNFAVDFEQYRYPLVPFYKYKITIALKP